jgi:hypothetical protein
MTTTTWNARKLLDLRARRDDLLLSVRALGEAVREAVTRRMHVESLAREQEQRGGAGFYRPVAPGSAHHVRIPEVAPNVARNLERARAEDVDLRRRLAAAEEAHAPLAQLVGRLETFLREHGVDPADVPLADAAPLPALAGPLPDARELAGIRSSIDELKRQRDAIASAPPARGDVEERIRAHVAERAAMARPYRPEQSLALFGGYTDEQTRGQIEAWLCAIAPKAVAARLFEIERDAADAAGGWGLPAADRAARLRELDGETLAFELEEERVVEQLEAGGVRVARRADADPRAVLAWAD